MKNFKTIKIYLFSFLLFINLFIYKNKSLSINQLFIKNNNIKVCICTSGKKENRYIREFVEYYIKLGVDKIFLYDNNDENGEKFEDVIKDYIESHLVKILNWRGKIREQIKMFNHCYKNNFNKYEWLIFYDIDEYINLKNYTNIKDFLKEKKFEKCQKIYLNWVFHTDNNLYYYENKTLHERFPKIYERKSYNANHYYPVKSILKGHIPNIKINCLHKLESRLTSCNGLGIKPKMFTYTMEPDFTNYFIDHYYFKSLEEFTEKLKKGSAISYYGHKIKETRLMRYIIMNDINDNKINYIENKTKINITILKNNIIKNIYFRKNF